MEYVTGGQKDETVEIGQIVGENMYGTLIKVHGIVHSIRDMSEFAFIVLRKRDGVVQCVITKEQFEAQRSQLHEGTSMVVEGVARQEDRAPNGFELVVDSMQFLSQPAQQMPLPVGKWKMKTSLETKLAMRPVALRNLRERAIFKLQEGIIRGFREYLYSQGFTEIHTPKIVAGNAEGGANVFKLEYFGKKAFLAQSPQFYKQMLVPVYERVFETAPVFRAEKHNTTRHLNEYTSLDFEMGFIDNFEDIMAMETGMLQYVMELLHEQYAKELSILKLTLPDVSRIPKIKFADAKNLIAQTYGHVIKNPFDLEPEEEQLIGKYFKEEEGSDFVFVTHYPSKKRPFYAMDDPEDDRYTLSFDLLYNGMEITTGGQRIHDYQMQVEKMIKRGMDPEEFSNYLMAHKHGMPPHGGLGIGMERLTMKLIGESNVRETTMFPRDLSRLEP